MRNAPVAELFAIVADPNQDDDTERLWEAVTALQRLGTREVLDSALRLVASADARLRARGADILGQLGSPGRSFPEECLQSVVVLLSGETDPRVLHAAAIAAGHLRDERATDALVALVGNLDAEVQFEVAFALGGWTNSSAIEALIRLTSDEDAHVRDWATFGLGGKSTVDTSDVRAALRRRLGDPDPETRGEAVHGLTRLGE
jgi:HEAT repeat protein